MYVGGLVDQYTHPTALGQLLKTAGASRVGSSIGIEVTADRCMLAELTLSLQLTEVGIVLTFTGAGGPADTGNNHRAALIKVDLYPYCVHCDRLLSELFMITSGSYCPEGCIFV